MGARAPKPLQVGAPKPLPHGSGPVDTKGPGASEAGSSSFGDRIERRKKEEPSEPTPP